jgi:hypothetical protein
MVTWNKLKSLKELTNNITIFLQHWCTSPEIVPPMGGRLIFKNLVPFVSGLRIAKGIDCSKIIGARSSRRDTKHTKFFLHDK